MNPLSTAAALYSNAMPCDACFGTGSSVARAIVDLPQPRWIGPMYAESKPRIVVLALNPGAGGNGQIDGNLELLILLRNFRNGTATFNEVLDYQDQHMPSWGKTPGRFVEFYTEITGKVLNELGFLNIALCATVGNSYPPVVLDTCFNKHTSRLLRALAPNIVLLSGSASHKYAPHIGANLPAVKVERVLHYAHREGHEREQQEFKRVHDIISKISSSREI